MPRTSPMRRCRVLQLLEARLEAAADGARVVLQAVLVDDVEHREAGSHRDRIAAEGVEVDPLGQRLGDLPARRHRRERPAVADALGHGHDVGDDAEVLEAPVVVAGAAEAGLHLVGDAEPAVLAHDGVRLTQVVRRAVRRAADALDRLGDERGDLARRRVADQVADVLGALVRDLLGRAAERAAVRIGVDRVMDAEVGLLRELPGVVRRERHRGRRAAVVAVAHARRRRCCR